MQYEVELKFPLTDETAIMTRLHHLGAVARNSVEQCDRYFNHPSRDFQITDEAFRIRSVEDANCITYKGPVVDQAAKVRQEIEIAIADGDDAAAQMAALWSALGFRFVRDVRKTRTPLHLSWDQHQYELALDRIDPLGTFLEIELLADEAERENAKNAILKLAAELRLTNPERRSYLELIIEHDRAARSEERRDEHSTIEQPIDL